MTRLRSFLSLTILGGLIVVLPIALLALIFLWVFGLVSEFIRPLTEVLTEQAAISEFLATLLAFVMIIGACFFIGLLIRTQVGGWLHEKVDSWLVKLAPGYKTIREVVSQFLGGSGETNLLNGEPALARIYGAECPVSVTAIVTSRHPDGSFTVFVPTAPIPTSGVIYHLPSECVELLPNVSVEEAMRTIIGCGSGSVEMLSKRSVEGEA
tara:strand:- start:14066 stop:14695 length:630 start_codon:yes stop_codon:yes gene_type:complete